jgi:hypothetical protein
VATLKRPAANDNLSPANYPIPTTGGIYSPYVGKKFVPLSLKYVFNADSISVIFRSGPDRYQLWQKFKSG